MLLQINHKTKRLLSQLQYKRTKRNFLNLKDHFSLVMKMATMVTFAPYKNNTNKMLKKNK